MYLIRLGLIAMCVVSPAAAQAQYSTAASDTLRYTEVTNSTVEMAGPNGHLTIRSVHDALLVVSFPEAGRALAWYEALLLDQQSPMGSIRPDTEVLLRKPFEMEFSSRGEIELIATPEIPAEIAAITDLTRQFDDFFITLPAGGLNIGEAWADTTASDAAARAEDNLESRHIRSYNVERDTIIGDTHAFLIRVNQQIEMNGTSEVPAQNMTVASKLSGTETGWVVFSPATGKLLERQRSGSMEGEIRLSAPGAPAMTMPQTFVYDSRITLVK